MKITEAMARAICTAKGFPPDARVVTGALMTGPQSRGGASTWMLPEDFEFAIAWEIYLPDAKAALGEINRAKLVEE